MNPDTGQPRVSIILPDGNPADLLSETVESILGQTFSGFELIAVSCDPADATPDFPLMSSDPRIIRIRDPRPGGTARSCNTGIAAARGDLIGFIQNGDAWDERKLEEQVASFSRLSPEYGVVYSDRWEVTPAGTRAYLHAPEMNGPELLNACATGFEADSLGIGQILVRRSSLDLAGPFDEELRCFSGTDMILRLQRLCRFHLIGKPLCISRSRQDVTESPPGRSIDRLTLLWKYPETLGNPIFVTHEMERIKKSLLDARTPSPPVPGQARPEPEHGQYRHPVPYS
jgi:glycosyltransferase involved in cell wall biosynthesis